MRLRAALVALALLASATAEAFPLTPTPLADTADGAELLEYLAGCAPPLGEVAVADTPAGPVRLEGRLGLAPDWRRG
jgi:hypothetical protein